MRPLHRLAPAACSLACISVAACSGDSNVERTYVTEVSAIEPALLAVTAVDGQAVAVGGPLAGDAAPSVQRRSDDGSWTAQTPPAGWQGAMWWIYEAADDDVWVVGANAQVARGPLDALVPLASGTSTAVTFYGVWGSPNDMWIVGADPRGEPGQVGFVLRYDGTELSRVELTGAASEAADVSLFKVWGSGPNDVFIVGGDGVCLHYDGTAFEMLDTKTTSRLTTVHGRSATEVYAVGGFNQGEVLRYDGSEWTSIGDPLAPPLSGVFASDDELWVAGDGGYLAQRVGTEWVVIATALFTQFHAVSVQDNSVFGVGGNLAVSMTSRMGFAGRYGPL